jgi:hypothetical protein
MGVRVSTKNYRAVLPTAITQAIKFGLKWRMNRITNVKPNSDNTKIRLEALHKIRVSLKFH